MRIRAFFLTFKDLQPRSGYKHLFSAFTIELSGIIIDTTNAQHRETSITYIGLSQFFTVGVWRSLVARALGVGEVAGSNPVTPTRHIALFDCFPDDCKMVGKAVLDLKVINQLRQRAVNRSRQFGKGEKSWSRQAVITLSSRPTSRAFMLSVLRGE